MIGMKKKVVGLDNGKYMRISSMYTFRCDLDLGIEKAACRRILCVCLTCLEILNIPWEKEIADKEQPRYPFFPLKFPSYNNAPALEIPLYIVNTPS